MSQEVALNNGQQAIVNTDVSKIFVGNNRTETATYTNGGEDPVTLAVGTLLGRIGTSGKVTPLASGASDGSQFPVGILWKEVTVDASASATVAFCVSGDVVSSKIILAGSDTLETVVSARRIKDRIAADTLGIKLVGAIELTEEDNQ